MSSEEQKKKWNKAHKATNELVETRVNQVQQWLLHGYARHEIKQNAAGWGIADRTLYEYVLRATERIKEINEATIHETMGVIVFNYWALYRGALAEQNLKLAADILEKIAKFKGLDSTTLIVKDERHLKDLSQDELDALIEEARRAGSKPK